MLSELTLCEHPINNKHLDLNDEVISRLLSSCSLMLMISMWQEFLGWENWATEKLNNMSCCFELPNSSRPGPSHSCVYTNSQTSILLWRSEEPSFCQASFFSSGYMTPLIHTCTKTPLHTNMSALIRSPRTDPNSVFYIQ